MNAREWERRVDREFGYLRTEFGCTVVDRSDKDWWETSVTYRNTTAAVKVAYSTEFVRLIAGGTD